MPVTPGTKIIVPVPPASGTPPDAAANQSIVNGATGSATEIEAVAISGVQAIVGEAPVAIEGVGFTV